MSISSYTWKARVGHPKACLDAEAGVALAFEELAGAGAAGELVFVDDGAATREDGFRGALNLDAFEHRVIDTHVMRFDADYFAMFGIEDDDVGVGTDGDLPFRGNRPKSFAGEVETTSTKRLGEKRLPWTPPV